MISLITIIIALALVALLTVASVFYINQSSMDSSANIAATQSIQEGSQIKGAAEIFRANNDGQYPKGTSDQIKQAFIDADYLKSWPNANWSFRNDYAVEAGVSKNACDVLNKKYGLTTTPTCADAEANLKGKSFCCVNG